ncbi:MAG TPA: helix-turn-helix transcriptional regulator [Agriterribacter sp.]|nr:helix-turn-helix transcriptional regulator [Agriterribacter sp.]
MQSSILPAPGTIAELLTRLRTIYQPTPKALAAAVGMSYTTYLKTERGQRELSFLMALRICKFYKMDIHDFVAELSDAELGRSEFPIQKQQQKTERKKAAALKAKVVDLTTRQPVDPSLL